MGITISPWMMAFLMLMTGFAGFVDSAAGGGGLISLPAYLFAGLPPHYTYATNKFSAACGTTFATANFFKSGAMNVKVGVLAAIGSFAGSALGAHIVLLLSDEMLRTMMFIILPVAAVIILWQRNLPDENRDDGTLDLKKILLALAIGLGIGLYDGVMEGKVALAGKARGLPGVYVALFKKIDEMGGIHPGYTPLLGYTVNHRELQPLLTYLQDNLHLDAPLVRQIGCVIGTHTGPGAFGIAFFDKELTLE